jgi:hypothetical protein
MNERVAAAQAIVSGWILWILFFKYVFGFGWPHEWHSRQWVAVADAGGDPGNGGAQGLETHTL